MGEVGDGRETLLGRDQRSLQDEQNADIYDEEEAIVRNYMRPSSRKSNGDGGSSRPGRKVYQRSASYAGDELKSFRSCLSYLCLDQSSPALTGLSWALFMLLTYVAPAVSHFVLACPTCDSAHGRPFNSIVQVSLTVIATLSFLCLSTFVKHYGLRRFLFLDKLCGESEKVRLGYISQLNRSFKLLSIFVLPCFIAESAYKIWWYSSGGSRIPFLGNVYVSDAVACIMELCSWLYRTSIFFLVCVLFRLICYLQIFRLQDFTLVFHQEQSDVATILKEHLRIRRQLRIISHRFRAFIVSTLIFVTASQLASLLTTTSSRSDLNFFMAGELALCCMGLVTGMFICLRSSTKITHKAQAITTLASKWHVCATIDAFEHEETTDCETPIQRSGNRIFPVEVDSDEEEVVDEEDEVDALKFVPPHATTVSFQKRQALVNYLENNRAGISVFGFMLDRSSLHTIFCIELSLVLWLLGKTIGIS